MASVWLAVARPQAICGLLILWTGLSANFFYRAVLCLLAVYATMKALREDSTQGSDVIALRHHRLAVLAAVLATNKGHGGMLNMFRQIAPVKLEAEEVDTASASAGIPREGG
jgi:hypothetical protein